MQSAVISQTAQQEGSATVGIHINPYAFGHSRRSDSLRLQMARPKGQITVSIRNPRDGSPWGFVCATIEIHNPFVSLFYT